jgi:hypothetical protein
MVVVADAIEASAESIRTESTGTTNGASKRQILDLTDLENIDQRNFKMQIAALKSLNITRLQDLVLTAS